MSDAASLKDIFSRYAGKEILLPERVTCDCDPVMDALDQDVRAEGFAGAAPLEKGAKPYEGYNPPSKLVIAEYEEARDGKLRLTGGFKVTP